MKKCKKEGNSANNRPPKVTLDKHTKKLEILNRIIINGNKADNLRSVLKTILDSTLELMNFEGGGIYLINETGEIAEIVYDKGLPPNFIENEKRTNIEDENHRTVLIEGSPIFTENYHEIDSEKAKKWNFLSLASVPLFDKDKIIGALNIASKSHYSFSKEKKNILQSIGREAGTNIAKMRAKDDLEKSEERLRNLFEYMSSGVVVYQPKENGKDFIIKEFNNACEKIEKIKREKVIGRSVLEMFPSVKEFGLFKIFQEVLKTGKPKYHPLTLYKDKRLEGWRDNYVYRLSSGEVVAVYNDITKQKKYEQKLKDSKILIEKEVRRKTGEIGKLNIRLQQYAKKLDLKIKRIDEKRVPLTNKEKLAFYGLVRYPNFTSKKIGERIGLQEATVNSIKNRLKKEGYFKTRYIPRYDLLGCALLSVCYMVGDMGAMDKNILSRKTKEEMQKKIKGYPEKIYSVPSKKEAFSISVSQSWSDYKEIEDSIEDEFHKKGIKFKLYETIHFPLDKSTLYNYFNFASILKNMFELDIEDSKEPEPRYKKYILSQTEKKLIYSLIKYPEYTVAKLSKKIRISVPTICKLRRKILETGMLKVVNWPNFNKIGMELIVFSHDRYMLSSEEEDDEDHKKYHSNPNIFFSIWAKKDHNTIALYKNYTEAREKMDKCPIYNSKRLLDKPIRIIIPLESIRFSKIEFAPLIKKIFKLDIDF